MAAATDLAGPLPDDSVLHVVRGGLPLFDVDGTLAGPSPRADADDVDVVFSVTILLRCRRRPFLLSVRIAEATFLPLL